MCRCVVMREFMWVWMSVDCASCMCINCASRCSTTNYQQLFAVKLAEASESVMPTSSLVLLQLRCKRRRHLQRQGETIGLWWRLGLNVLATAQRIATELASTRPGAVATSTAGIAPMKQRQQVKAYALQEYQAKADKNVLEFFFDTWQALWAKLFDA